MGYAPRSGDDINADGVHQARGVRNERSASNTRKTSEFCDMADHRPGSARWNGLAAS
jgi:hypothetical protein